MKRREFITLLGGVAAWPLAARAQQAEHIRRTAVLTGFNADVEAQSRIAAFQQELEKLGWSEGRNIIIESRFGGGDSRRCHCKDHVGPQCNELFREHLCLSADQRKAIVDVKIAVPRPSPLCKSLQESGDPRFRFRIVLGEGD